MKIKRSTNLEEYFNASSHGIMTFMAIIGLVILIIGGVKSSSDYSLFSGIIYGVSLIILYFSSTIYHAVKKVNLKQKLRILDHASIYLLIAGTYTPVALILIGGTTGWVLFAVQWGLAIIGIILKLFFTGRFEVLSLLLYALMGWMIVIKIEELYAMLPGVGFWLMLVGGITYTVGILFYVLDKKVPFSHFIWHLFVMGGSCFHYFMISLYII